MKMTLTAGLFVAASAAAFAQQAPSGSQAPAHNPATHTQQSAPAEQPKSGEQTITGCLTSADNVFTLTMLDADQPPGSTVPTVSYTLAPGTGVDLKPHVNRKVQVRGTEAGEGMQNSARVVVDASGPRPTGTSGTATSNAADNNGNNAGATAASGARPSGSGDTPTVETSAKARIVAKTLNVSAVQAASGNCTEVK